jgi:hypothetical protein
VTGLERAYNPRIAAAFLAKFGQREHEFIHDSTYTCPFPTDGSETLLQTLAKRYKMMTHEHHTARAVGSGAEVPDQRRIPLSDSYSQARG